MTAPRFPQPAVTVYGFHGLRIRSEVASLAHAGTVSDFKEV